MRKIILTSSLLMTILGFSQETEFKFTKDGFTDYVVTPVENKTAAELYKKTIDWVHFGGLEDGKFYFNENREVKSKFKIIADDIPKYFNSLNKSLYDFIINGRSTEKKNDW
jgi:hypothetical protein